MAAIVLTDAGNCLYAVDFLQVVANVPYILDIVDIQPECSLKDAVVALVVHLLYIDIKLSVYDGRYLMYHSNVVDTGHLYRDYKIELLVCIPCCCKYPVAMAALYGVCNRTVAFVDYDLLLLVVVSQYIIARYGVAAAIM